jgi:hypothetical protein
MTNTKETYRPRGNSASDLKLSSAARNQFNNVANADG